MKVVSSASLVTRMLWLFPARRIMPLKATGNEIMIEIAMGLARQNHERMIQTQPVRLDDEKMR